MTTFRHTFNHNGKISPAWWKVGGCTPFTLSTKRYTEGNYHCQAYIPS